MVARHGVISMKILAKLEKNTVATVFFQRTFDMYFLYMFARYTENLVTFSCLGYSRFAIEAQSYPIFPIYG